MITIACYNIKGGVGKTSTAVNLAYLAAQQGARTLLWDLDPQGAASFYYRIKPKVKGGIQKVIAKKADLDRFIKGTDFANLHLLPADFSYRNMDLLLEEEGKPQKRLRKLLSGLKDEYDYVFLDCPPSISLMTESVFVASDILLLPTIPTTLSLRTLDQVIKFTHSKNYRDLKLMPFFSMVDRRKNMHRLMVESPPKTPVKILGSAIPYASEVERMGMEREPVAIFAPHSKAASCYQELWREIQQELL
jgi:cellulose biosynthesis protein BcsQ